MADAAEEDIQYIKTRFKRKVGYDLNLENPQTMQEKLQWIKIYGKLERFSPYTDKYEVRSFIEARIGGQYLIPLIGVYEKFEDIDFDALPRSFAMKATHGSKWNIIVKDKREIDWNEAKEKMSGWLNSSWYEISKERNYKDIRGRILLERNLHDLRGGFKEYRLYCYHGERMHVRLPGCSILVDYDCHSKKFKEEYFYKRFTRTVELPKNLSDMYEVAYKLAKDFPYVRVDLYSTRKQIYAGELTFAPGSGFLPSSMEYGLWLGSMLDLNRYV